jgi:hypothetical protein
MMEIVYHSTTCHCTNCRDDQGKQHGIIVFTYDPTNYEQFRDNMLDLSLEREEPKPGDN